MSDTELGPMAIDSTDAVDYDASITAPEAGDSPTTVEGYVPSGDDTGSDLSEDEVSGPEAAPPSDDEGANASADGTGDEAESDDPESDAPSEAEVEDNPPASGPPTSVDQRIVSNKLPDSTVGPPESEDPRKKAHKFIKAQIIKLSAEQDLDEPVSVIMYILNDKFSNLHGDYQFFWLQRMFKEFKMTKKQFTYVLFALKQAGYKFESIEYLTYLYEAYGATLPTDTKKLNKVMSDWLVPEQTPRWKDGKVCYRKDCRAGNYCASSDFTFTQCPNKKARLLESINEKDANGKRKVDTVNKARDIIYKTGVDWGVSESSKLALLIKCGYWIHEKHVCHLILHLHPELGTTSAKFMIDIDCRNPKMPEVCKCFRFLQNYAVVNQDRKVAPRMSMVLNYGQMKTKVKDKVVVVLTAEITDDILDELTV